MNSSPSNFISKQAFHVLLKRVAIPLAIACLITACTTPQNGRCTRGAPDCGGPANPTKLSKQRLILNQGYSLLYTDASHFDLAVLILYVKSESKAVDDIVTAVADFGKQFKSELERAAKEYPAVRIDLDPLPEMEKRKRAALTKDRAEHFAPIVGHGGREYERTLLIAYVNGIDHERHLCQVMAEEEPDPNLKQLLTGAERKYDGLYARVAALLNQEYFKDPNGKSKD